MKKTLSTILILNLLTFPALAIDKNAINTSEKNVYLKEPKWEEFAPQNYIMPNKRNKVGIKTEKIIGGTFLGIGIVGGVLVALPFALIGMPLTSHASDKVKENYWYQRKNDFDINIQSCKNYTTTKDVKACYEDVKKDNLKKNELEKLKAKESLIQVENSSKEKKNQAVSDL